MRASPAFSQAQQRKQAGFALLSVLTVIAIASALAMVIAATARADRQGALTERRIVQATALADAGLARLAEALSRHEEVSHWQNWNFANHHITLTLTPETAKIDLNTGDPTLVANVLRAVVKDRQIAERMIARLAALRRARKDLQTIQGLMEKSDRGGALSRELERLFTVYTAVRGVDVETTPDIVLLHLPGLLEGEGEMLKNARKSGSSTEISPFLARFGPLLNAKRPIYRAHAAVTVAGVTARREALLAHNPETGAVWTVFQQDWAVD